MIRPRLLPFVSTLLVVACLGAEAWAGPVTLDPFRPAGAAPTRRLALDPVQSTPAPDSAVPADAEEPAAGQPATPAKSPPAQSTPALPVRPPGPIACQDDAQCPDETICENAICQRIEHSTNILYLYYREGTFREVLGLYWSKRGPTGFTVLAPFYWHFFAPKSRARVVAPFYWHFEDDAAHRTATVIVPGLPVSWSHEPGARSFGIWPLFYKSTKYGWAAPLFGSFTAADPAHGKAFGALAFLYWWDRSPEARTDFLFPLFLYWRQELRRSASVYR